MNKFLLGLVWATTAVLVIFIVSLPINLQTHLIAGAVILGVMMTIKMFSSGGTLRLVALALGTAVVMRYVYWRTTSTLPPVTQLENFIPGLLLYLAEMYSVFMLALSLFIVAKPLPSRSPNPVEDDVLPSVDVFIPSYNEDAALLADTIAAAKAMDYPPERLTVWLLDDGGTVERTGPHTTVLKPKPKPVSDHPEDVNPRRWKLLTADEQREEMLAYLLKRAPEHTIPDEEIDRREVAMMDDPFDDI